MENLEMPINNFSASDLSSAEEFLEHHGILGMKWGKRHGPPYPLDDDISTGKRLKADERKKTKARKVASKRMKAINKKKKALAKWKAKIAKDPKKLAKHADKFTSEEIAAALKKFEDRDKVKAYLNMPDPKPVTLSLAKKHMSRNEKALYKNRNKFTPEEMELALNRINYGQRALAAKNSKQRLNIDKALDAMRIVDKGLDIADKTAKLSSSIIDVQKKKVDLRGSKLKAHIDRAKSINELREIKYKADHFDRDKMIEGEKKFLELNTEREKYKEQLNKNIRDAEKHRIDMVKTKTDIEKTSRESLATEYKTRMEAEKTKRESLATAYKTRHGSAEDRAKAEKVRLEGEKLRLEIEKQKANMANAIEQSKKSNSSEERARATFFESSYKKPMSNTKSVSNGFWSNTVGKTLMDVKMEEMLNDPTYRHYFGY